LIDPFLHQSRQMRSLHLIGAAHLFSAAIHQPIHTNDYFNHNYY